MKIPKAKKRPARTTPRASMPRNIKPMLATLADEPFDRPGWFFEIKWDGFRAISEVENGAVRLYSDATKVDDYPGE